MKFKAVLTWDEVSIYRLFRIMGTRGIVGDGTGYSWKLAFAITTRPKVCIIRSYHAWVVYFIFLRISYHRSYGGMYV